MEKSELQTLKEIPISETNTFSGSRRRRPLKSRTVDTLLHILSLCYADSSHVIQNSDKGVQIDVPLDCPDGIPNDSLYQEQMAICDTRVVLDAQEDGLHNKHVESSELENNILGEKNDLSQKAMTSPLVNFDIRSQDNYDMICSSPNSPTKENVEEGEISGDFVDDTRSVGETNFKPRDFIGTKMSENNSIPLFKKAAENGGKDVTGVVNKSTRNLVDYSEVAVHAKSPERTKQVTLKVNAAKNQDLVSPVKDSGLQYSRKRRGSFTEEERRNKKSKQPVDPTTCPENITLLGKHLDDASQEVIDTSANKVKYNPYLNKVGYYRLTDFFKQDACNEKKRKRVLTKERKAKKKMKDRLKRAEQNRKLGIRRLKLKPVIKEKKIIYCHHYMNGRCHEGEKCKFSHDTTPLTKSKPCCHFARHACMKGDNCPYDHQLSKYPCNNYQTKGVCNRGSDCMFSHEAQPSEASLNGSNKSMPEHKTPPNVSSQKVVETKSCAVVSKFVGITPKSTRPPKGINFLSLESHQSPKVDSEVKEITKTPPLIQDSKEKTKTSPVVQASEKVTKTPTVVPRGINFLSFGKKPGLDYSSGGFSFRISNRVEKPQVSDVVGGGLKPGSSVNVANEVKVDFSTDRSRKPMLTVSFMSSTSQKALQSTLAFASELDLGVKSKV
ncbi:hypothetical protein SSX86_004071 [Deinandra increscens subsp. villosa]|uniref:C3H1-type domain-containing protein n=1 Tax=Deinandra increscens subsp. villosa TaxID=3103831 RepID=A0AAP0DN00_9ASTR